MSEQFITDRYYCTADSHVDPDQPSWHPPTADGYTNIGASGGTKNIGLFKFSGLSVPEKARVIWARMYFTKTEYESTSDTYIFTVRPCRIDTDGWSEDTVTYNVFVNRVQTDTISDTVSIGHSTNYIDIPNIVEAYRLGTYTPNKGLYIACSTRNSRKQLYSHKVTKVDDRPYLQVCYTFPTGTPSTDKTEYTLGDVVNVTVKPAEGGDTHTLTYKIGDTVLATHPNISTSDSYTTLLSSANYITDSDTGTLTIVCETFRDGASEGTETVTAALHVPTSIIPSISSVSAVEGASSFPSELSGSFVQSKSKLLVTVDSAGAYGSTISKVETVAPMGTYSGASFTTDFVTTSGTVSLVVTVTDSRGRTATFTKTVSVEAYSPPTIAKFGVLRCDEDGTIDREGTYARAAVTAAASPIANKNAFTVCVQYRAVGASTWTSTDALSATDYTVETVGTVLTSSGSKIGTFDDLTGYEFQLNVTDSFATVSAADSMPTKKVVMDFYPDGSGVAFGADAEANKLVTAWDIYGSETAASGIQGTWVNATLESGVTTPDATLADGALRYRRSGNIVYLAGGIQCTPPSGSSTKLITTIPAAYVPQRGAINWLAASKGVTISRLFINQAGEIHLSWTVNISNGTRVTDSGVWIAMNTSWFID